MRHPAQRTTARILAFAFILMNVVPHVYALAPRDAWLQHFWLGGARAPRRGDATLWAPLQWTFAMPDLRTHSPRPARGPLALMGHAEQAGQPIPLPLGAPAWFPAGLLFAWLLVAVGRAPLPAQERRRAGEPDAPDPPPRARLPVVPA